MAYPNRYLAWFVGGLSLADESVDVFHSKRGQNTENVWVERRKRRARTEQGNSYDTRLNEDANSCEDDTGKRKYL